MKMFRKGALAQEEVVDWLREMRGHPHVPESGFDVTAVFRVRLGGQEDYYFAGGNVEYTDHRLATHAEEGSISAMVAALGKNAEIVEGWVMGAPRELHQGSANPMADNLVTCCGKCRQQIASLAPQDVTIHSVSLNGNVGETTVREFLPDVFSFRDFAPEADAERRKATVGAEPSAREVENKLVRHGALSDTELLGWLKSLESVDFGSKKSEAVILKLDNGAYVAGSKVEEAAYIDIGPVQSALAIANAEFDAPKVVQAWSYVAGRDGKGPAAQDFAPLNLSSLQALAEFSGGADIPVTLFNGAGETLTAPLSAQARYMPTSARPFIRKP